MQPTMKYDEEYGLSEAKYPSPLTDSCRNCGELGHFARDCSEPKKLLGACFACGEVGHNKADCPNKGPVVCHNCFQQGHKVAACTNPRLIDHHGIDDKTLPEAWEALKEADRGRDFDDIREAMQVYVKSVPWTTYAEIEVAFRANNMNTHLIALEKEVSDTYTVMDLQGNLGKKYCVGMYFSDKPQRARMQSLWPKNGPDNLKRLEDAGIQVDRLQPKCDNCGVIGHIAKVCPRERQDPNPERYLITCINCGEVGHRLRDCTQPRKDPFACRNCGESGHKAAACPNPRSAANVECRNCGEMGHFGKDCPTREKRTCRSCDEEGHFARECPNKAVETCHNCSEEGHKAKECPQPRNPATMKCRNCDQMGHMSKECPAPRDYSRIKCNTCGEMGHTSVRCFAAIKDDEDDFAVYSDGARTPPDPAETNGDAAIPGGLEVIDEVDGTADPDITAGIEGTAGVERAVRPADNPDDLHIPADPSEFIYGDPSLPNPMIVEFEGGVVFLPPPLRFNHPMGQ